MRTARRRPPSAGEAVSSSSPAGSTLCSSRARTCGSGARRRPGRAAAAGAPRASASARWPAASSVTSHVEQLRRVQAATRVPRAPRPAPCRVRRRCPRPGARRGRPAPRRSGPGHCAHDDRDRSLGSSASASRRDGPKAVAAASRSRSAGTRAGRASGRPSGLRAAGIRRGGRAARATAWSRQPKRHGRADPARARVGHADARPDRDPVVAQATRDRGCGPGQPQPRWTGQVVPIEARARSTAPG